MNLSYRDQRSLMWGSIEIFRLHRPPSLWPDLKVEMVPEGHTENGSQRRIQHTLIILLDEVSLSFLDYSSKYIS